MASHERSLSDIMNVAYEEEQEQILKNNLSTTDKIEEAQDPNKEYVFDPELHAYAWKARDRNSTVLQTQVLKVPTPVDKLPKQIPTTKGPLDDLPSSGEYADYMKTISVAGKYNVWGLTRAGHIFSLDYRHSNPQWIQLPTGIVGFYDISCGRKNSLFAIGGADHYLYRFERDINQLQAVELDENYRIEQISAISYRKVYATTEVGVVMLLSFHRFREYKNAWEIIKGPPIKKVAAGGRRFGSAQVWGIGTDGWLYRYHRDRTHWEQFQEQFLDLTVTKDGVVFGIRMADNAIVKWNGERQFLPINAPVQEGGCMYTNISAFKSTRDLYTVNMNSGDIVKIPL